LIGFDGGDSSEEVGVDEDVLVDPVRFFEIEGGSSEEVDVEEDVVDRVCFFGRDRGESSEEEVDEVSIGRNAHSAMPLSFDARGQ
jgi:hypothetical protein